MKDAEASARGAWSATAWSLVEDEGPQKKLGDELNSLYDKLYKESYAESLTRASCRVM